MTNVSILKVQGLPAYNCMFVPTDQKVKINIIELGVEDMVFMVEEYFAHLFTCKTPKYFRKEVNL